MLTRSLDYIYISLAHRASFTEWKVKRGRRKEAISILTDGLGSLT